MSLQVSRWAWQQDIKAGPKIVLLALADYADAEGMCYPSLKQLTQKCGLKRTTIIVHLKWLTIAGFIKSKRQYNQHGYRRNNRYYLNFPLDSKNLGSECKPTQVRNLNGNTIDDHINDHKYSYSLKSEPRKFYHQKRSPLEGAI